MGNQFGLISGSSIKLNVPLYSRFFSRALEEGTQMYSVYTEISNAFNKVHQGVLVSNLKKYGISEPLLAWLKGYLTDRMQIVCISGFMSR